MKNFKLGVIDLLKAPYGTLQLIPKVLGIAFVKTATKRLESKLKIKRKRMLKTILIVRSCS